MSVASDDALGLGWVPAPAAGSAARRTWPRTARLVWWLLRRPLIPLAVAGVVLLALRIGPVAAVAGLVVVVVGLSVWEHIHPASAVTTNVRAF
jgi:hypothetical protein